MLLTGGLGYLGGRLAQTLSANNCELKLATRRAERARAPTPAATIVQIDWASDAELERVCEGVDAIVHLAGMNAANCADNPAAALEFNGVGTARLVRAATLQRVARFIHLSTAHVYGTSLTGHVDERTCPEPCHPYATSHRAGEDVVRLARTTGAMSGIVLRLSNSFGAPAYADADCWSLVANDLCRQAVTTHRAVLRGLGTQRRDFVPISEACRAISHLLTVPESAIGDGIFNVGSGWAPTIFEFAELITRRVHAVLGFSPQVEVGTVDDDPRGDLVKYCVKKLISTGFEMRQHAIVEELDRLVVFCTEQWGGLAV